ncbi:hypothetical protein GD429_14475 [Burkholderia sp. BE17]|nr:hypothetical protein [Burkholderia sp. BE17]
MSGSNGGSIQRKSTVVQFEFSSRPGDGSGDRIAGRRRPGSGLKAPYGALWRLIAPYGSQTAVGNT